MLEAIIRLESVRAQQDECPIKQDLTALPLQGPEPVTSKQED